MKGVVEQGFRYENLNFGVPGRPRMVLGWLMETGLEIDDF